MLPMPTEWNKSKRFWIIEQLEDTVYFKKRFIVTSGISIQAIRQIIHNDDVKNTCEFEYNCM